MIEEGGAEFNGLVVGFSGMEVPVQYLAAQDDIIDQVGVCDAKIDLRALCARSIPTCVACALRAFPTVDYRQRGWCRAILEEG